MNQNGNDTRRALAIIDTLPQQLLDLDPQVELPQTANAAAIMVDWLGLKALSLLPQYADTIADMPKPNEDEQPADYTLRVLKSLKPTTKGVILDLGLAKVLTMDKVAKTGIQLRVWRAFKDNEWQHSPHSPDSFYEWVKLVIADEADGSLPEANKLASLCEAIAYVLYNNIVDLPHDVEAIFRSPLYRRYKAILPRLRALISDHENADDGADEIEEQLADLIENVADTDITAQELDEQGKKSPSMPPMIFTEAPHRDAQTGEYLVLGKLSATQRRYFQRKLGKTLDYRLEGEEYNKEQWMLSEYRSRDEQYHFRMYIDEEWSEWYPSTASAPTGGYLDTIQADDELGLTYARYWQRVENE